MASIRQQRVSKDEIYIQASDGREITITRNDIQNFYSAQTGNAAARRAATITEFKTRIQTALGAEQVPIGVMVLDFNQADLNAHLIFGTGGE